MIPFTQFVRPNGAKRLTVIKRPPEIEALAQKLIAAGYRFEIEELMTGAISMEILKDVPDPDVDDSLTGEICNNGPAVPESVDKMIREACQILNL